MSQLQATNFITRSPHYRTLQAEGAQFIELNGAALVDNYGQSTEQEIAQAKLLGIADLCMLPRTGFKGQEAIQWTHLQGAEIGAQNNCCYIQNNGSIIARLADTEVLVLNAMNDKQNQCILFDNAYQQEKPIKCYSVPRFNSSAWFLITGQYSSDMFAKMCGVDLRTHKFSNYAIAQTSVARLNAIIIRNDIHDIPAFHFLFDNASADYMWSCFKDAFREFHGTPIGYTAITTLLKSKHT